jgi:hypothetical protein
MFRARGTTPFTENHELRLRIFRQFNERIGPDQAADSHIWPDARQGLRRSGSTIGRGRAIVSCTFLLDAAVNQFSSSNQPLGRG